MTEDRKPWPQFSQAMREKSEAFKRFKDSVLEDPDHWSKAFGETTFQPEFKSLPIVKDGKPFEGRVQPKLPPMNNESMLEADGKLLTYQEFIALGVDPVGPSSPKGEYASDEIVGRWVRVGINSFTIHYVKPA